MLGFSFRNTISFKPMLLFPALLIISQEPTFDLSVIERVLLSFVTSSFGGKSSSCLTIYPSWHQNNKFFRKKHDNEYRQLEQNDSQDKQYPVTSRETELEVRTTRRRFPLEKYRKRRRHCYVCQIHLLILHCISVSFSTLYLTQYAFQLFLSWHTNQLYVLNVTVTLLLCNEVTLSSSLMSIDKQ